MREILTILERDAHATAQRIAALTGLTEDEIRERIAALEASGVIRRYEAVVDWERFGDQHVVAFIDVSVAPARGTGFGDVAERISRFPEVRSVYLVSGQQDLRCTVTGGSIHEVADFVTRKLSTIDRVQSTATHFVLKTYKREGEVFAEPEADHRLPVTP